MPGKDDIRRLYLNGQWAEPQDPLPVINPATTEVLARIGTVPRARVAQAIQDAAAAWPAWRSTPGRERGRYLYGIADVLQRRREEIARTITLENGKPLAQSGGEVAMTVDHLRWFAGEAQRAYGRVVPPQADGKRHLVLRTPVGVVGAIAPWNFPLVLAVRKVAAALAAGCPVVLKPASATPLSAVMLAEAVDEVKLMPGVFQLVLGRSAEIGAEMLENPLCRKITFTGSTAVGKELIRGAAACVTKLSLELGGHAPVLVFEDADLEQAVRGTVIAKFRNTGQSCIAANRVYVQRSVADRFIPMLVDAARRLKVGHGLEENVEIGPLINAAALEQALEHIEEAQSLGARVLCGGKRWAGGRGYFLEPTILADVPPDARCMREETFAPAAPVCLFEDESEAIRAANATEYGLAAYAFTRDLSRMWRLAESLEAGTIGINDTVPAASQCPFGGCKQSGWGRELGLEGLDAFMETKHISLGVQP
ncbi:MAG: NAD-dependent succinate-semialdehyde dehydrogenase [Planctomycetes bacterium]|jgi:succinate-semialdehyde dehydrogenase/glutarate-semialdehyde dehydrogenase|nr:NAD-dependent succinate-semialdehyde dehydrogenase [Planctomycetota bacterium]